MNWGKRILFIYLAFVCGIVLLVFKSHGKAVSLVSADYYEKELNYSAQMQALQNYYNLSDGITMVQKPSKVAIAFPQGHWSLDTLNIFFYKPNDSSADKIFNIHPDEKGIVYIDKQLLKSGKYIIKMDWIKNHIPYAFEQSMIIH